MSLEPCSSRCSSSSARRIQVDWQADAEPLQRAAAGRTDGSFLFPENANDVLKHEPRPREELVQGEVMQRYNARRFCSSLRRCPNR
jgi:hypothetical protein